MEALISAIPTLGFPIVCCLALGFFVWQLYKASEKREERLMTEITENRLVNKQFADLIGEYKITLSDIKEDVREIKETLHINHE